MVQKGGGDPDDGVRRFDDPRIVALFETDIARAVEDRSAPWRPSFRGVSGTALAFVSGR